MEIEKETEQGSVKALVLGSVYWKEHASDLAEALETPLETSIVNWRHPWRHLGDTPWRHLGDTLGDTIGDTLETPWRHHWRHQRTRTKNVAIHSFLAGTGSCEKNKGHTIY